MAGAAVGVIGLGATGVAVAERLRAKGYPPHVFDPLTKMTRNYLVHGGAGGVATAAMIAQLCDIILIVTENDQTTDEVTLGPTGVIHHVRPDTLVVDVAEHDIGLSTRLARALAPRGAALVDAALVGVGKDAGGAGSVLFCSGRDEHVARCQPIFDALASRVVRLGDTEGAAHAAAALARLYGALTLTAAAETFLIGKRFGLQPARLVAAMETLSDVTGALPPPLLREVLPGRFDSGYPLDRLIRDMDAALATAQAHGTPAPLARLVRELVASARLSLKTAQDHTEIVRWLEANADATIADDRAEPPSDRAGAERPKIISVRS
jgi:3-hydroxyisobutyrate dehydrogenase-like beta-hydroxyacid dehydrogenase